MANRLFFPFRQPRTLAQRRRQQRRHMLFMRALRAVHNASTPTEMTVEELEKQRRGQELLGRLAAPSAGTRWAPFTIDGMPCAWTYPLGRQKSRRVILYCHGGGYTSGNLGYSRVLASKLAHVSGAPVLAFEYRLAPEHPYPAAVEDAVKVWDYLMYQGHGAQDIIIAGDSAGGNLALVLTLLLKKARRRLPCALLLFSPWTDMTAGGKSYRERAAADPVLTPAYIDGVREAYAHGRKLSDWRLSPLFGRFRGFPPTLIQVGTNEILYSDASALQRRLQQAGVVNRLEVWEEMWHVFQMFPTRKATDAMRRVAVFLGEVLE